MWSRTLKILLSLLMISVSFGSLCKSKQKAERLQTNTVQKTPNSDLISYGFVEIPIKGGWFKVETWYVADTLCSEDTKHYLGRDHILTQRITLISQDRDSILINLPFEGMTNPVDSCCNRVYSAYGISEYKLLDSGTKQCIMFYGTKSYHPVREVFLYLSNSGKWIHTYYEDENLIPVTTGDIDLPEKLFGKEARNLNSMLPLY